MQFSQIIMHKYSFCNKVIRDHNYNKLSFSSVDPEGGTEGPDPPPLENHKLYGFLSRNKQLDPPSWKKLDPPSWKKLDPPPPPWEMLDPLWNLENDSFLPN